MNTSRGARISVLAVATIVGVAHAPGCSGSDDSTSPSTAAASSSSSATGSGGSSGASSSSSASGSGGSAGSSAASSTTSAGTAGSGGGGAGGATGGSGGVGGAIGGTAGSAGTGGSAGSAGAGTGGSKDGGTPSDGGGSDGSSAEAGGGGDAGTFFFAGDFLMMGTRLCWKNGNTGATGNRPPFINWGMVPTGTMSIVVTLRDFSNQFVHWIACNIPPATMGLPAGTAMNVTLPMGASQSNAWFGPGAGGAAHMYQYKVWAMKTAMVNCANISDNAKSTLWTQLTNDEMGAKAMVLDSRAIFAYGNTSAQCQ